jgi:allantoate deiminase
VRFTGAAGHAGTVPMAARRDALAAAAEWMLVAERLARATDGLVATVGELAVAPGARNVIPGEATLSADVRHADDGVRLAAVDGLREAAAQVAAARGVATEWTPRADAPAVAMDPALTDAMAASGAPLRLPSGAGHDAAMLATIAPAAMLFVRCRGGVSHNPAEHVEAADVDVALDVLERWVEALAA